MTFQEYSKNIIKKNGGRITKTKLVILKVLENSNKPLAPYAIAEIIKKSGENIDVVTVYRALKSFLEMGLVHKIEKGFTHCMDHKCQNNAHCHHTFTCNKCSEVKEIHIEDKKFIEGISKNFKDLFINSHNFQFEGLCKKCKN